MPALVSYSIVGVVAAALSFSVVPGVRLLAIRWGAVVDTDDRGVHREPTAAAGGAAMLAGMLGGVVAALLIGDFADVVAERSELLGVVGAAVLIFAVGLVDDIRDVSPLAKIAGMVLAGAILAATGVSILVFRVPFFDQLLLSAGWSAVVTVLWVVGMANVVNLIDGLDGLAAGIVAIASGAFLLYALRLSDVGITDPGNPGALWAVITLGVCVGFLPHNVFPARVFMGDSGALLLGVLLAASTMSVGGRSTEQFSGQAFFFFAPLVIPLVILGVPVLDTAFAIVRRTAKRSSVWVPDKDHLHHRLIRVGYGHRRAVIILWSWTALLSAFVLYPTYSGRGNGIVPIGIAALALGLYMVLRPRLRDWPIAPDEGVQVDEAELDRLKDV